MLDFDVQAFMSLPHLVGNFEKDGKYCAVGKFNHVMGFTQLCTHLRNVIDGKIVNDIVSINDYGIPMGAKLDFELRRKARARKMDPDKALTFLSRTYRYLNPNPEKASRLLIESLRGKVNFINEGMVFTAPAELVTAD